MDGPFSVEEARAAGISYAALQGKSWRRVGRGFYCRANLPEDPWKVLRAFQRVWPQTVFSGSSAAWLHGLDIDPIHPIEVIAPCVSEMRSRPGVTVHHVDLPSAETLLTRGLRTAGAQRAFCDLRRRLSRVEVLVVADAALRLGLGRFDELAEPAESPMETRLRWLLIRAGLPRPRVQAPILELRARADLYYPASLLIIEYDGENHRDRLVDDNRRQNLLINAGYRVLRFTASDIYNRPETIVALVRGALSEPAAVSARRPAAAPR